MNVLKCGNFGRRTVDVRSKNNVDNASFHTQIFIVFRELNGAFASLGQMDAVSGHTVLM